MAVRGRIVKTTATRRSDIATAPAPGDSTQRLFSEIQRLREELDQTRRRIGQLEQLSDQDGLLPLINRRAFLRELSRVIAFVARYQAPACLLYFDVNDLKAINDGFGHRVGDAALRRVAACLLGNVRSSDVVGRLGGDEFGVILAQADSAVAATKARQLADLIAANPLDWGGQSIGLAAAYGVRELDGGDLVEAVLDAADRAMYAQKQAGLLGGRV
jgi:diguanylate cyclase (GGDEF)-like protein